MFLARFVSQYRAYAMTIFPAIDPEKAYKTGVQPRPGMVAEFQHGDVSPWEAQAVLDSAMPLKGVAHDEDITRRFSVYDTDLQARYGAWSEELHGRVLARLRSGASLGTDYMEVAKQQREAPWPAYDKLVPQGARTIDLVAKKIAETVVELGLNPETVLAYERDELNRTQVVAALEALAATPAPEADPEPLVAA